uniref:Uncharacterized protein n=1 Tax=Heterorhabditis bacteriophora TaxID=37862 RepID=A0A1I7X614_HETBA
MDYTNYEQLELIQRQAVDRKEPIGERMVGARLITIPWAPAVVCHYILCFSMCFYLSIY